jgi:CheY-like chemotaxis protein
MSKDSARTVLVVDDNDDIRQMLTVILSSQGYRVVVAADGEEAIEIAGCEQPDAILMDVMMPRLNGLEAACRIQQNPQLQGVPIIGISAFNDPLAEDRVSTPFRWSAYLRKPIDMDELEQALGRALASRAP